MKVFILTEGGDDIGFGHITRCISLYQAFEEKGITSELIVKGDKDANFSKDKKYRIFNWLKKQENLFSVIRDTDILIIDSYLADYEFYRRVSEVVRIPVYIDDTKRLDYPRGIVINGTIYAEEMNYPQKEGITYLLGSKYIPIRKEFWDVPKKVINEVVESVMITLGGNDAKNITPKILKLLLESYPLLTKNVVIGKGFKNINIREIEKLEDSKTELFYYPDAEGMKSIMLKSDIAISAGGQTLYELARVGVPTIAVAVAENQLDNLKGWQRAGFIEYAGWWDDEKVLSNVMHRIELLKDICLRQEKAKTGRMIIDGLGAVRVVKCCLKRYFDETLILRKAEMKDMLDIYELSNELETRKNSFNQEHIELESHRKWFLNKLKDTNCIFLVAEVNNNFVGQVRFDVNKDEAVISISICKKYRGLGIATLIIQKSIERLKTQDILYVKSYIKEESIPSIKLFEKANFQFVKKTTIKDQKALEYLYRIKRG